MSEQPADCGEARKVACVLPIFLEDPPDIAGQLVVGTLNDGEDLPVPTLPDRIQAGHAMSDLEGHKPEKEEGKEEVSKDLHRGGSSLRSWGRALRALGRPGS